MFDGLSGMDRANALYLAIILVAVLIGSASLRGIGIGRAVRMAGAWVAIFAVILIAATYQNEAKDVFGRLTGAVDPARGRVEGNEFHIRSRDDGHFWVRAEIDDEPVLFLIDTGASGIVLTEDAARRVGIDPARLAYDGMAQTANGSVRVAGTRVAKLEVGPIVRTNMRVSVTEGALDTNLLGMDFLRTLGSWRVEGGTLIIRP
jgi:aspartyl protease family protein